MLLCAAAVFLKNFMFRSWEDRKIEGQHLISEDDKQMARDNILQCMIMAPDATRRVLREVVSRMIDDKFPSHFPGCVDTEKFCSAHVTAFCAPPH